MKIIVTGGAGFIGSHVAEHLVKEEHQVVIIDTLTDYYNPEYKQQNLDEVRKAGEITLYKEDIRNEEKISEIFSKERPDVLIHLAAGVGVRASLEDPLLFQSVNVGGTVTLLECAKDAGIKKLVIASSSSIYGENTKVPFSETDETNNIVSPYAASKKAMEVYCEAYSRMHNLSITCLRFFTVYGPRGRPEMAPYKFTKAICEGTDLPMFGDGSSMRDYTYIADIVRGVVASIDLKTPFDIINLGNSSPVSLKEFIATIESVVGTNANIKQLPDQKGDVPKTYADVSKAKQLLGYNPSTSLKQGMTAFFDWYRNTRDGKEN